MNRREHKKFCSVLYDAPLCTYFHSTFAGIELEFCVRVLTILLPSYLLKVIFYHSSLVLLVALIIGRYLVYYVCVYAVRRVLDTSAIDKHLVFTMYQTCECGH